MANKTLTLPDQNPLLKKRFRGYLPVVVDIETGGFDPDKNPLLEMAIVTLQMDADGRLHRDATYFEHIQPFSGSITTSESLEFTGIDPDHPFRFAVAETIALQNLFKIIRAHLKHVGCQRAILVGHNPAFDLSFLKAAVKRCNLKRNPFHAFSSIDTASLGAVAFGQTVLARATMAAGIGYHPEKAHSAIYDAEITADLFCTVVNQWDQCLQAMGQRPPHLRS